MKQVPDQSRLQNLANKWLRGEISSAEQQEFNDWFREGNEAPVEISEMYAVSEEQHKQKLWNNIQQKKRTGKLVRLWPRIVAVSMAWKIAAAVAAIVFGIWFFSVQYINDRHPDHEVAAKQISGSDIAPGKNTATLTLANGKTIALSDQKTGVVIGDNNIKYNDGSFLSPSGRDGVAREGSTNNNPLSPQGGSLPAGERSKVQTLTASTPRGGTYQVTLPDGTRAWLNADSKISFPSQFTGRERKILLSGEAYFEVFKNKKMPFVVESRGQRVEVLGTHFNINSYSDEASTKTTLLEGSVRVAFSSPSASRSSLPRGEMASAREGNTREGSIVLKPNQQSTLLPLQGKETNNSVSKLTVNNIDPAIAVAWRNGDFIFKDQELTVTMRQIARWYNVDIVYEPDAPMHLKLGGSVSRANPVSVVLKAMEKTGKVKFKIEGRRISVSKT